MGFVINADATILYDTAGTYFINTTVDDDVLTDNADAHVVVGNNGVIRGNASNPTVYPGAVKVRRGSLEVAGNGRIIAGTNPNAIDLTSTGAVVTLRDQASVTGNIYSASPGYNPELSSSARLFVQDHAVVNGNVTLGGFMRVQDQALILGDVRGQGFTTLNLDLRGGTIVGAVALGGADFHRITMSGGAILGGVHGLPSWLDMTMSDGYIDGGIRTSNVVGSFRGGQVVGGIFITPSQASVSSLNITGGAFDAYGGDWLLAFSDSHSYYSSTAFSTLDISGGQFGYGNAGNGFFIDEWVNFNIYGRDLVYSNGWLTGYLQDGNWFNNQLTFGSNWHGTLTIHNVPEPGTLALLAVGLISMGWVTRRRAGLAKVRARA
ncbi:PEP-CTERM sorting domain-containing protein [Peristeroidobacter soli]|uniref:PEP-CTERM sorting domain-containing protein n=1 Tax=Peristeroidobacter soli TaxID=2497877 RepID=UPI001300A477|nr:PEP-CTERM sorting domain-containing protein [Peristeroidobacter soli]